MIGVYISMDFELNVPLHFNCIFVYPQLSSVVFYLMLRLNSPVLFSSIFVN